MPLSYFIGWYLLFLWAVSCSCVLYAHHAGMPNASASTAHCNSILAFWHFGISALMCLAIRYHLACQMYQTWGLCWGSVCLTHLPYECYGHDKRTCCVSVCVGHIVAIHNPLSPPGTPNFRANEWYYLGKYHGTTYYCLYIVHTMFSYGDYEC